MGQHSGALKLGDRRLRYTYIYQRHISVSEKPAVHRPLRQPCWVLPPFVRTALRLGRSPGVSPLRRLYGRNVCVDQRPQGGLCAEHQKSGRVQHHRIYHTRTKRACLRSLSLDRRIISRRPGLLAPVWHRPRCLPIFYRQPAHFRLFCQRRPRPQLHQRRIET